MKLSPYWEMNNLWLGCDNGLKNAVETFTLSLKKSGLSRTSRLQLLNFAKDDLIVTLDALRRETERTSVAAGKKVAKKGRVDRTPVKV